MWEYYVILDHGAFHLHNYLYQSLLEAVSGIKCACLIVTFFFPQKKFVFKFYTAS